MRGSLLASLFVVLCGGLAGWFVWQLVPAPLRHGIPDLHRQDYRLVRNDATAFDVTDAKWLAVPWLYADFDLTMDVELGEAMDLDVVLRQVEPRALGSESVPFHGRFAVLRLSTRGAGPAWRTRGEALFEPRRGGAELAPGHTATVWVQARGRALRANVAGKWHPWFLADDEYGALTLVANGGKAVLKSLEIRNLGQPNAWLWSSWLWVGLGLLVGSFSAAVLAVLGTSPLAAVVYGALQVGFLLAFEQLQSLRAAGPDPLRLPAPGLMAALFLLVVLPALAAAVTALRIPWLAALLGLLPIGISVGFDWPTLFGATDRQLDRTFGPAAGSTLSEALAQRVRGRFEVHDVSPAEDRVFLLGGQLLYDRGAPTEHLEPLLAGDLRSRLQRRVDVPCLPTQDGHSQQQWRLFERFFWTYRPGVLVFGVPRDEAAPGDDGKPRSSAADLRDAIERARLWCAERSTRLVLFTEHDLPADLLAEVQQVAAEGVPLVVAGGNEPPAEISRRLADAIAPLLPKAEGR